MPGYPSCKRVRCQEGAALMGILAVLLLTSLPSLAEDRPMPNRLSLEKSPYLLKHATNPVDWYPWGEEAFRRARELDKPIFLSIGYSTCHWCNVMEEESFADPEVAARLNKVFVAIKVDREERPDIDLIYMQVCQMLVPTCGWPLTVFMTADRKPFFVGSYFPKRERFGRPGLMELMDSLQGLWRKNRQELLASADSITLALMQNSLVFPGQGLGTAQLEAAFDEHVAQFDSEYGGFGRDQKFPRPHSLLFLLRYWHSTGKDLALAMVEQSLTAMRQGGIFDQLGFGFHRYTTDRKWHQPHFEKMLVDQAQLLLVYTEAFQATGKDFYRRTAKEIADYILNNLQAPRGAFFTAESADSEGEEGRFYLWKEEEIRRLLPEVEAVQVLRFFHMIAEGNFVDPIQGQATGQNVLYVGEENPPADWDAIRGRLLAARQQRPRPDKDDKILADWNGLTIAALARAAVVFDDPVYGKAASRAADFLLSHLRDKDGRLLHRWRDGEAGVMATASDYAFLILGLLDLYAWELNAERLQTAQTMTDEMLRQFWDEKDHGFFLNAEQDDHPLLRIKELDERQLPSANAAALLNLLRLARLTGKTALEERAAELVKAFSGPVGRRPGLFPIFLAGILQTQEPSREIVIVGRPGAEDTRAMLRALYKKYAPGNVVIFKSVDEKEPAIVRIAPYTEHMTAINGEATAYVCTNFQCSFPTNRIEKMLELLEKKAR